MALYSTVAWDGSVAAEYIPPRGQSLPEQALLRSACADALQKMAAPAGALSPPSAAPLSVGCAGRPAAAAAVPPADTARRLQCSLWSCRSSRVAVQLVTALEEPVPDAAARGYLAAVMRSLRASFIFGAALPQAEELRRLMKSSAELQLLGTSDDKERSDTRPQASALGLRSQTADDSQESIGDRIRSRLLGLKRMMGSAGEEAGPDVGNGALMGLLKRRKMAHDAADQTVPEASVARAPQERYSSLEDVWKAIAPRLAAMLNSAAEDCNGSGVDVHESVANVLQGHRRIRAVPGAFRRLVVNVSLLFTGHCRSVKQALLMQTASGLQLLDLYLKRWGSYVIVAKHMHDVVAMRIFRALTDHEGLDSSPDIFSIAIKAWREHTVGNEVGIEKQLAQAMSSAFAIPQWLPNDRRRIASFVRALLTLPDVAVFDAIVRDVLLGSLTAAVVESARDFAHSTSEPQLLQRQVAALVQWYNDWERQETERLQSLAIVEERPFDVLGALAAAPFACPNAVLGSLAAVYSTMLARLQETTEAHRRQLVQQHLAPLLLNSLDVLIRNDAWEEVAVAVSLLESMQQRPALGRSLFGLVRAEGAAIIGRAPNQPAGEVVAALATFIRRFERGLPSLLVAEGSSGLSMLEKMLITVMSLLPAAALRLWEAVREGNRHIDQLHADVVTVLRYVQDKDDFERQLAIALAYRLAGGPKGTPAWMRAEEEAQDLLGLVERLKEAFGNSLVARVTAMQRDCLLSTRSRFLERGASDEEDEEEIGEMLVVDEDEGAGLRMQVLLCDQANWPRDFLLPSISPKVWSDNCPVATSCALPEEVQRSWADFCTKQRVAEPHKRATFLANQGWAEVELEGRRIWVTTAMMSVLGLLAEAELPQRFDALSESSRLPGRLLRPTLMALCHAGVVATNAALPPRAITVDSMSLRQSISSSHHFFIAWECVSSAPAVIDEVHVVDEVEEDLLAAEEEECLALERRKALDESIVGILRSEEAAELAALKQMVIGARKHASMPQPATIQERIDALVEQRVLCYDPPGSSTLSLTALRKVTGTEAQSQT